MVFRPVPPKAPISNETSANCKLYASSAECNALDICRAIASVASETGDALEIASGTGQHIVTFGLAMPNIHWHPSEIDIRRHASIKAYITESGLTNIAAPITLNATQTEWHKEIHPKNLVTLANLLHLISKQEAKILITEAAKILLKDGVLLLYGPFKRNGKLTSKGDVIFDAKLRAQNRDTGSKDDKWITEAAKNAGLSPKTTINMPANNLAFVFTKS